MKLYTKCHIFIWLNVSWTTYIYVLTIILCKGLLRYILLMNRQGKFWYFLERIRREPTNFGPIFNKWNWFVLFLQKIKSRKEFFDYVPGFDRMIVQYTVQHLWGSGLYCHLGLWQIRQNNLAAMLTDVPQTILQVFLTIFQR